MNDQVSNEDDLPVGAHLTRPPSRRYWLDEVRLKEFPQLRGLLEDPPHLQRSLDSVFGSAVGRRVLAHIRNTHGDTDAIKLHLVMVAAFLAQRRSAAVLDVALDHLDDEALAMCTSRTDVRDRLSLATLLYCQDPERLIDVDLWDRWHARRRCVYEIDGQRRRPLQLATLDWRALFRDAQETVGVGQMELRSVLPRREGREVLLAFRQIGGPANVRTDSGEVVPGHDDEWTLLLFHDGGNAVDITATALHRAAPVASALAAQMWDDNARYVPIRRRLRVKDLRRLLARLTDPDDDTFQLLEITAAVPQLENRPVVTLANAGQVRIERSLAQMRRGTPLGYDWADVFTVKVGFMDQYRIAMHFPIPGEELVLTYSDVDRNKDASAAFVKLIEEELGVVTTPKAGSVPAQRRIRRAAQPPRPKRVTPSHLRPLMGPVVDRPDGWGVEELRRLADQGLIELKRASVLRCGNVSIGASGGGDTLDCSGELEMAHRSMLAERPIAYEEDQACECSTCGRRWYPARAELPVFPRLRVEITHDRVWRWLLESVRERAWLQEVRPGMATGALKDEPVCLVYLPLACDPADRALGMAATFSTCWVGWPPPQGYHDRGVDLADVFADGTRALTAVWKLGRDVALPRSARARPHRACRGDQPWDTPAHRSPADDTHLHVGRPRDLARRPSSRRRSRHGGADAVGVALGSSSRRRRGQDRAEAADAEQAEGPGEGQALRPNAVPVGQPSPGADRHGLPRRSRRADCQRAREGVSAGGRRRVRRVGVERGDSNVR